MIFSLTQRRCGMCGNTVFIDAKRPYNKTYANASDDNNASICKHGCNVVCHDKKLSRVMFCTRIIGLPANCFGHIADGLSCRHI